MKFTKAMIFPVYLILQLSCSNKPAQFTSRALLLSDTDASADVIMSQSSPATSDGTPVIPQSDATVSSSSDGTPSPAVEGVTSESIAGSVDVSPVLSESTSTVVSSDDGKGKGLGESKRESKKDHENKGKRPEDSEDVKKKFDETFSAKEEEKSECGKYFQKKNLDGKISGSKNVIVTDGKQGSAFKVTGNRNSLTLNYKDADSESEGRDEFEGLCVFVAGNQNKVNLVIDGVLLKQIVVIARGNQGHININIEGDGEFSQLIFDGKGKAPGIEVTAPASFPCKDRIESKSKGDVSCKVKS